ncbi:phosphate signaling complex protein PhoU [Salinarchaeum sp. IM2453]|uniref:phosphate signaling complex protein PhoU n=1 Tax=Salinarchaeum sp. IM2453 TaxID=2862870 RepID=UPI001C83A93E|nr:phosphate signaling complex protein PhoU [Salinarchaeum sp. IM2453]QZA89379.1 phosphate signaling complex protein PhoU [Salinarchaeum sp. IM2453]
MPRDSYQQQLDDLREDVVLMADEVNDRYIQALNLFTSGNRQDARAIIDADHEINERYLDLEQTCIDLFALQQPVASDLRFVASSFKIITDLERVGDIATNLAKYATAWKEMDLLQPISIDDLLYIAETAQELLMDAVAAYDGRDATSTWNIAARDEQLDQDCRAASDRIIRSLINSDLQERPVQTQKQALDEISNALLAVRDIERVGDHAVNICARTLYMEQQDAGLIY